MTPDSRQPSLEVAYSPRQLVADAETRLAEESTASRAARERLSGIEDCRYGPDPGMCCDLFGPGPDQPTAALHVFLHGGFWRSRDKSDYSYVAEPLARAGITTIVANYGLCPDLRISEIVDQIVNLFLWVRSGCGDLGLQPCRLTASGHSAGAHLVAAACARQPDLLEGPCPLAHATLISGLYDLRPMLGLGLNTTWRLDPDEAVRTSPTLQTVPKGKWSVTCLVGGAEPDVWHRQSEDYARHLQAGGHTVTWLDGGSHDHFSVLRSIEDPASPLQHHLLSHAGGRESRSFPDLRQTR